MIWLKLWIGHTLDEKGKPTSTRFEVDPNLFRRHLGTFGSTGSGKTVLSKVILEEAAMRGIPIIAFDVQGDIASLKMPGDPVQLEKKGINPSYLQNYLDKVVVNIFTPASKKGLPISINPLVAPHQKADEIDVIRLIDSSCQTLTRVLIKKAGLTRSYESATRSVLYEIMEKSWREKKKVENFIALSKRVLDAEETLGLNLEEYMKSSQREKLAQALRSLTIGTSKLLFEGGEKEILDFTKILKPVKGKTPINVLFLPTLITEEEKLFFLSLVLSQLYSWMLRQGAPKGNKPRCIVFCDEVAPYIPAGAAKPGPKEAFLLLFRQARKYGVEFLVATQSPKDVDYKAFEQFNTLSLGRITSPQSRKVVAQVLDGSAGETISAQVVKKLTKLKAGSFMFVSPDLDTNVNPIQVRWLLTNHTTLTEDQVAKLYKEWAEQIRKLEEARNEKERLEKERLEKERLEKERLEKEQLEKERLERGKQLEKERLEREKQLEKERREKELQTRLARYKDAADDEKVIEAAVGKISHEDIVNAMLAHLEHIAKTQFGLPFLRELVQKKQLNYEKSRVFYIKEVRAAIKEGLAQRIKTKEGKKTTTQLVYDFDTFCEKLIKELDIKEPEYLDRDRLAGIFENLLQKAKRSHVFERILLGQPLVVH